MALGVWFDGDNWVIAESASEAVLIAMDQWGYTDVAQYQRESDDMPANWKRLADDTVIAIHDDDTDSIVRKTAEDWVKTGPQFLGSVNY